MPNVTIDYPLSIKRLQKPEDVATAFADGTNLAFLRLEFSAATHNFFANLSASYQRLTRGTFSGSDITTITDFHIQNNGQTKWSNHLHIDMQQDLAKFRSDIETILRRINNTQNIVSFASLGFRSPQPRHQRIIHLDAGKQTLISTVYGDDDDVMHFLKDASIQDDRAPIDSLDPTRLFRANVADLCVLQGCLGESPVLHSSPPGHQGKNAALVLRIC